MAVPSKIKFFFPLTYILPLIILIEGFVSIGIEMLTIRQLLPLVGNSVVVTSLIIGIFLLFLALGYRQGGRYTENLSRKLRLNFTLAAIWLGVGLSYVFIYGFFNGIQKITGTEVILPLLVYLLFILAPLIYILGQTIPITMNLVKQDKPAGIIGGNTLGLSTLGSFLGAILSTLVLMQYLGVAWTIFVNFVLLFSLVLLLVENLISFMVYFVVAMGATVIAFSLNILMEKNLLFLADNYANYQIMDANNSDLKKDEKILLINDAENSFTNAAKKSFPYVELIKKILFSDMKLQHAEILVLGAGGFSLSAENNFKNHFTYVDIDKKIKRVAIPRFLDHIDGKFIADDARHFLLITKNKYDVIVADAYTGMNIPAHLLTREYMISIQQRLNNNGIAIFNIIANPMLTDAFSKRVDNTIRTIFSNCMAIPENYTNDTTNIIYVCAKRASTYDHKIYTDNLNTVTTDSFNW